MKPERWKRIDEIAQAALEKSDEERAAFIAEVCKSDDSIRREVESLLAYQQQAAGFLESPAIEQAAHLFAHSHSHSLEGQTLSHYRLERLIAQGGMGSVYLAHDSSLDRQVAIKFLSDELTADQLARRRLIREARAAAKLDHPNICSVYEVAEQEGQTFIVMQYVEGQTLAEKIKREPMEIREVIDIAAQVADALAEAHSRGIVHRDIKPANIMLTARRHVKVLDFGLAKRVRREDVAGSEIATESLMSEPGVIAGTVPYMSPEQLRAEATDARSDIFSFGVVLYEMITGRQPFAHDSSAETIAAIQMVEPASLLTYRAEVPEALECVVEKSMRKDREERYQTAQHLLNDLNDLKHRLEFEQELERSSPPDTGEAGKRPVVRAASEPVDTGGLAAMQTAATAPQAGGPLQRHKLGVSLTLAAIVVATVTAFFYFNRKPVLTDKDTILLTEFDNKTGDAVFDGTLKQALSVHLGQSPFLNLFSDDRLRETLRLMSRPPDERVTPIIGREICQRHGLKAMLTGSIVSLGRNYVINLEAVNAQTGEALAREQGEAEGKEQVLRSLGEAASRLRQKLGESLRSIQKFDAPLEQVTTSSLEALKAYSMGLEQYTKGKFVEAIPFYKHAIELDPNFAYAYASLALVYFNTKQLGLAAEAARKAFELRERVSEREKLFIAAAYYTRETGEYHKAIEALELCTQTYPRDVDAHINLAIRYNSLGQHEKAVEEYREVLRLNPNQGLALSNLSATFVRLNRFEEAKAMAEQAIAQKIENPILHYTLYNIALIQGDTSAMQQQVDWSSGRTSEYDHLQLQANVATFAGQWRKARELYNRAAGLAQQRNLPEAAGDIVSLNAEGAAILGQCRQSRADLARAAAFPRTLLSFFRAGFALALCGDGSEAQAQNDEAVKRYPKSTVVNEICLPLVRAAMELQRGNRTQAIQMLQAARRYESVSWYFQNYLRGQAYLGEEKGAEAASEFQNILDHRGWEPTSRFYPLAHLGLARAAALQGDTAKARKSYQDFLALWKDADVDLPVLIEAKKEYASLK